MVLAGPDAAHHAAITRLCSADTLARAETMAPCCQAMAWLRWSPAN
jgi:hypothetical protein